ncbi:MliC family protein [Luteimonas sp. SDU82]|uniref:MliC family protein n=1 Tax=Luteimonas sp. SDU82 TaxID=3422592 RepID=UPI003EB9C6FD
MRIALTSVAALLLGACRPAPAPAPAAPAADPASPSATPGATAAGDVVVAHFRCGDLAVGTRFDNARGELVLTPGARRLVLQQAVAASGARYVDAAGNEFWNKGDAATLVLDGQQHDCSTTDEASPWDEARTRGVSFRGLGTEPFWALEVDRAPAIRLELDAGARQLRVDQASILEVGEGYAGTADDGSEVVLRIRREACSDGMSDQHYPASIELQVGEERLRGCGGFLEP